MSRYLNRCGLLVLLWIGVPKVAPAQPPTSGVASAPVTLAPEDTAIVELDVPDGARVNVDGVDYGSKRHFEFNSLKTDLLYRSRLRLITNRNTTFDHELLLKGGWKITLPASKRIGPNLEVALQSGHGTGIRHVALSPDDHWLITAGDREVVFWDVRNGTQYTKTAAQ